MVTVDDGAVQLGADLVELVAEVGHLVGAVFVACDDLINRVDDDGRVVLLGCPADELRRQLVHGDGFAAQLPDVDVGNVVGWPSQGVVYVFKAVQTARPVQFQVDVQDAPLGAVPVEPLPSFGDSNGHLDEGEGLAGFRGACQHHLVPFPQYALNKRGR